MRLRTMHKRKKRKLKPKPKKKFFFGKLVSISFSPDNLPDYSIGRVEFGFVPEPISIEMVIPDFDTNPMIDCFMEATGDVLDARVIE